VPRDLARRSISVLVGYSGIMCCVAREEHVRMNWTCSEDCQAVRVVSHHQPPQTGCLLELIYLPPRHHVPIPRQCSDIDADGLNL
jgi:hypothetical protein